MPLRLSTWNVMINCGNPTRSVLVLDLIKAVKKKEVGSLRKQGIASVARRLLALEAQEFVLPTQLLHFNDAKTVSAATR